MNDICRDAKRAQLGRYIANFVFGLVRDAAHPEAERPQGRNRAAPRKLGVFGKNLFRVSERNEEISILVFAVDDVMLDEVWHEVERHRRARMNKHSVSVAAHEKRDGLV